ncbi:MAG: pentapeptide repeat-containing protein [Salinibacter sp.]|uniref:pentapeptide repeat-containing protein n=1 Tax=Salinibacter sp. TaxID=2065818 RepID=UPI0035D463D8
MSSSSSSWSELFSLNIVERRIAPLRADRPVLLSFLVFLVLAGAIAPLSLDYWTGDPEFPVNLIAEVHGTLLDLLLFGCLLLWFDQKAERRRRIEKYINAIRDLLGWESEMATYRIVGNIRRLNREGAAPETLKNAYLTETDLKGADLSETSVHKADLSGTNLQNADLSDAYLGTADFSGANLQKVDFSGAHFGVFAGMAASEDEQETVLTGANLRGADLRGIRSATASTFAEAETLFKARLDADLEAEIEEKYPELLEPHAATRRG